MITNNLPIQLTEQMQVVSDAVCSLDSTIEIEVADAKKLNVLTDGASERRENKLIIHLDSSLSVALLEATYVHEILHEILRLEGFPYFYLRDRNICTSDGKLFDNLLIGSLIGSLNSIVTHSEIYRRMWLDHSINMNEYFNRLIITKNRFRPFTLGSQRNALFVEQQAFLLFHECLFYNDPQRNKCLKIYKSGYPIAYGQSMQIERELRGLKFENSVECGKLAQACIKSVMIIGEGRSKSKSSPANTLFKSISIEQSSS